MYHICIVCMFYTKYTLVIMYVYYTLLQVWKVKKATGIEIVRSGSSTERSSSGIGKGDSGDGMLGLLGYKLVFTRWNTQQTVVTDKPTTTTSATTVTTTTATPVSTPTPTSTEATLAQVTLEADRYATEYLGRFLLPIILAMAVRSLIYDKHISWYSYSIGVLTAFVYSFGFILMLPQLFINYKLKSVAHLPWKFLIYKFLNTFIDGM